MGAIQLHVLSILTAILFSASHVSSANGDAKGITESIGSIFPGLRIPFVANEGQLHDVAYRLDDDRYGFGLGDYDSEEQLVTNPLLASTFLGGSDNEFHYALDVALGPEGAVYVACRTQSPDFPTTSAAYDTSYSAGTDIVVSKFNRDLTILVASTFLGGSGLDDFPRIVLDSDGHVIVSGMTYSTDFPTTAGAFDTTLDGSADAFLCRLDGDLTTLLASTYLGGAGDESFPDVAADRAGDIFIAGTTTSSSFPTTTGSVDTTYNGGGDFFVSKFSNDLSTLLAATYLGGKYTERHTTIAVDEAGRVFLSGGTESIDFPTTPGVYDPSFNGPDLSDPNNQDILVSRFDNDLTTLSASTFLGTWDFEAAFDLALDENGAVYVTGHTTAPSFPTTVGAYDRTHNGYNEGYMAKLDSDLSTLLAATFLSGNTGAFALTCEMECAPGGLLYVCGCTGNPDFPTTDTGYDRTYNGGIHDQIVLMLKDNLSTLQYATFIGGSGEEGLSTMSLDNAGNVYLFGSTASADFPTTPGAYDESYCGGAFDKYVLKLGPIPTAARYPSRLDGVTLERAVPNPFNPTTTIRFYLPDAANTDLSVYSVRGQAVVTLLDKAMPAGTHAVLWNGENEDGAVVASGTYFCRLLVTGHDGERAVRVMKLTLIE